MATVRDVSLVVGPSVDRARQSAQITFFIDFSPFESRERLGFDVVAVLLERDDGLDPVFETVIDGTDVFTLANYLPGGDGAANPGLDDVIGAIFPGGRLMESARLYAGDESFAYIRMGRTWDFGRNERGDGSTGQSSSWFRRSEVRHGGAPNEWLTSPNWHQ
jgi:hypothetical protein